MEERRQMHKPLRDLIEIIHFTENVSAKIHGVLDEAEIYRTVREEFAQSKRYSATILLLTDDESKLRIAETTTASGNVKVAEKVTGLRLREYEIDVKKSGIYSQVIGEGKAVQASVTDTVAELFPRPLANLLPKILGLEKELSILTPLKRHGKIMGVLAVTSTELAEHFIPSVRSLAQHVSNALDLADEYAERKRAEEQLRESEERYRTLYESSRDGIAAANLDGRITECNQACAQMLGYSREELKRISHQEITPSRWHAFNKDIFREVMERGYSYEFEEEYIRKDGTVFPVSLRTWRIDDEAGNPIGVWSIVRDITERKRAEEALRRAHDELEIRVQERTAELAQANEALQAEITERKQAEEALRQRNRELELLNHASQGLSSILHLDQVLSTVLEEVRRLLGVLSSSVWLIDPEKDELVCRQAAGPRSEMLRGWRLALEEGVAGWAARHGQSLIVPDTRADEHYFERVGERIGLELRSTLTVPMRVEQDVIGVLQVVDTKVGRFDTTDLALLEPLAASAAIAIENAQLYEAVQRELAERKRAEEALGESEERYRAIVESQTEFVDRWRPDGTLTFVNEAYCRYYGKPREELIGHKWMMDLAEEDQERVKAYVEHLVTSLSPANPTATNEQREVTADGRICWQQWIDQALFDEQGHLVEFQSVGRDITERKRAEEALENSLSLLQATLESTADGILVVDNKEKMTSFNQRFAEMWRIPDSIVESRNDDRALAHVVDQLIDPDAFLTKVRELYDQPDAESFDVLKFKDGRIFERYSQPQRIGGKSVGRVWSFRDVTERKQAEEELRVLNLELDQRVRDRTQELAQALSRNQAILGGIADGVIVFDNDGKAIVANPAIAGLLEWPTGEIVGRDLWTLAGDDVDADNREIIGGLLRDREVHYPSVRLEWGDKTLSVSIAPVQLASGETIGSVAVFRDFTREAEIDRMKSAFVSTASHELRTPLSAVLGYADMLQSGVYGPLSEKQHSTLERIIANTGRLLSLVGNLLDQAQIEAGTLELNITPFTLADLINDALGVMDVLAQAKGLELTSHIADGLPDTLFGDRQRLYQILINLVGNAIRFTDEGTVRVRAYQPDTDRWALEVSDTGRGIPPEVHSYIFEPFRHVDESPTRDYAGAGLGLSIVKQLTEMMGGEITLESEVGRGSTFTIVLPMASPA